MIFPTQAKRRLSYLRNAEFPIILRIYAFSSEPFFLLITFSMQWFYKRTKKALISLRASWSEPLSSAYCAQADQSLCRPLITRKLIRAFVVRLLRASWSEPLSSAYKITACICRPPMPWRDIFFWRLNFDISVTCICMFYFILFLFILDSYLDPGKNAHNLGLLRSQTMRRAQSALWQIDR